jgi:polyhydroxyalkanoate synthase
MHSAYLRTMYQNNLLRKPGGIELAGVPIDIGQVRAPAYFLSTRDDHIAPWPSTYAGARLLGGKVRFVLGGSGHIAGVINPATSNKYGYWTGTGLPEDPKQWLAGARHREGSWWPHWLRWIRRRAGGQVAAREPGAGGLAVLEDAPGSFVKVRI